MSKTNWFDTVKKDIGYNGCKNCKNQIEPLRSCEWMEHGGDGKLHLICPRWERRMKAIKVFDEDRSICLNCRHMYWCEDCECFHCEKVIEGEECEPNEV